MDVKEVNSEFGAAKFRYLLCVVGAANARVRIRSKTLEEKNDLQVDANQQEVD